MNTKNTTTYEWLKPCIAGSDAVSEDAKKLINHLIYLHVTTAKALASGVVTVANQKLMKEFGWCRDKLQRVIAECLRLDFFQRIAGKKRVKGERKMASEYTINYDVLDREPVRETLDELYARFKAEQARALNKVEETEQPKMEIEPYTPKVEKVEAPAPKVEEANEDEDAYIKRLVAKYDKIFGPSRDELIAKLPLSYSDITDELTNEIVTVYYDLMGEDKQAFIDIIDDKYGIDSMKRLKRRSYGFE